MGVKKYLKKIIANSLLYKLNNERYVFLFHDISSASELHHSSQYSTIPENFQKQIDFLLHNFELISLDSLVDPQTRNNEKPLASIVFDDGFYSVYEKAYPCLVANNIPFTVFINKMAVTQNRLWFTNIILSKNDLLFWSHIYETFVEKHTISLEALKVLPIFELPGHLKIEGIDWLNEYIVDSLNVRHRIFCNVEDLTTMINNDLVTIDSHSVNHYLMSDCSEGISYKEIEENKLFIQSITGKDSLHFAIPFGKKNHYDKRVVDQCRELGYKYLYSTNPNSFKINALSKPPIVIPRIGITNESREDMLFYINMNIIKKRNL